MAAAPFRATRVTTLRQPCSLGLSALVAGTAVFSTGMELDLLGYALVGLAILLLLHAGLSTSCIDTAAADARTDAPSLSSRPETAADLARQKSASRA